MAVMRNIKSKKLKALKRLDIMNIDVYSIR